MKRYAIILQFVALSIILLFFSGCDLLKKFGQKPDQKPGETSTEAVSSEAASKEARDPGKVAFSDAVGTVFAVNTTKAVKGEILDYLEVNGDVVTRTSVDIFADNFGKLTKLNISLGDYVQKDQVIAEVDPSKPGMTFIPSPVKSPISGTIIEIPVQIGATITQGMPIARVSKMNELQIRVYLSERFISKIRVGLEALLHFEAYPDVRFRAWVYELSPVVDPQSRTLEARLRFAAPDPRIKSGMYTEVKIITDKKQGIVKIPSDCLVKRYGGYFVFVVRDDSTVEKR
ncbi:MAG TPA: efflux RND transporter periplasmic adaptor subunit, partial [Spirochaetia bacterium]|nr:efflux RND transporter periplasmic adaptor subunit [Spirochaetia bacterium]